MTTPPELITKTYEAYELASLVRLHGCHGCDSNGMGVYHSGTGSHDWHGGLDSCQKVTDALTRGSKYMLTESDKLMDKIEHTVDMSGYTKTTEYSVVGSSPSVGAFLAGAPNCMRRTIDQEEQSALTPITINIGLVSSGDIDAPDLAKRMAAILAFTRVMSVIRPVQLVGICAMRIRSTDVLLRINIGLAPLDLSMLCALAHPGTQRLGLYGICEQLVVNDKTTRDTHLMWPNIPEAKLCDLQPGDCHFKSPHIQDVQAIIKDPVQWAQAQLDLALKGEGRAFTGEHNK